MSLSHWHATLDRAPLPAHDLPARAATAVIGGGVLGAMAAYWLARAGAPPVLIERGAMTAGATGHNGGLCITGTAEGYPGTVARVGRDNARAIWSLTLAGLALFEEVVAEEGIECQLRRTGHLGLALDQAQLAGFRAAADLLREDGFSGIEVLDVAETTAVLGAEPGPAVLGARFNSNAASLHSAQLVHGLLAAATRHGARLCWGAEVLALRSGNGTVLVETGQGATEVGAVIVAVNAWSGDLLPGLADLIAPVRGQAMAIAAAPTALRCAFGASLTPTGEYGQQTPEGTVIFGGCRAVAPERDFGTRAMEPTEVVQTALDQAVGRLFPALAGLPATRRWAGTMAFTPDYLPVAGAAPELPGVWFAGGFCGHGMPFAAPLGRLLAEAALAGTAPAGLEPFGLDRGSLRNLSS